ncbi:hypothetical protein, partial [Escherichia coli]|uniref:hypothetical protein n=7 Tax=Enterobacteriaceae TaxID=543 RepID=UPI00069C9F7B
AGSEQESARGSFQGETPGIFIVLSGFATSDLSVDFCDACQGGGAYGKTPVSLASSGALLFAHMFFPALSPDSVDNRITAFE